MTVQHHSERGGANTIRKIHLDDAINQCCESRNSHVLLLSSRTDSSHRRSESYPPSCCPESARWICVIRCRCARGTGAHFMASRAAGQGRLDRPHHLAGLPGKDARFAPSKKRSIRHSGDHRSTGAPRAVGQGYHRGAVICAAVLCGVSVGVGMPMYTDGFREPSTDADPRLTHRWVQVLEHSRQTPSALRPRVRQAVGRRPSGP